MIIGLLYPTETQEIPHDPNFSILLIDKGSKLMEVYK